MTDFGDAIGAGIGLGVGLAVTGTVLNKFNKTNFGYPKRRARRKIKRKKRR